MVGIGTVRDTYAFYHSYLSYSFTTIRLVSYYSVYKIPISQYVS